MARHHDTTSYGAVWRLHFIAGLLVLPVLLLMAATGGAYLFQEEIDAAVYGDLLTAPAATQITPSLWLAAAETAGDGVASRITIPQDGRSAEVVVRRAGGPSVRLHLDPATARLLGETPPDGAMAWVKALHSLTLLGPQANLLAELAAGWAVVLVATGLVLWWPRPDRQAPAGPRGLMRRLHGWTGAFAGTIILFLALTGMPWSALWGKTVRDWTNAAGWGRPTAPAAAGAWGAPPARADQHGGHEDVPMPWALQNDPLPHGHDHGPGPVDRGMALEAVFATAERAGLPRPYAISLSSDPALAWSVSHMAARAEDQRTLYVAPDGTVVADIGYADFGPAAKAVEWGVATHQGRQYGAINRWLMLAGCLAIWVLALSGLAMWWIRRPRGRIGAPPRIASPRGRLVLGLVVIPLALVFPLVGGSLILAVAIDWVLRRLTVRSAAPTGANA
jgi:uncharacterized iron-regulated membrane protein